MHVNVSTIRALSIFRHSIISLTLEIRYICIRFDSSHVYRTLKCNLLCLINDKCLPSAVQSPASQQICLCSLGVKTTGQGWQDNGSKQYVHQQKSSKQIHLECCSAATMSIQSRHANIRWLKNKKSRHLVFIITSASKGRFSNFFTGRVQEISL